MAARIAKRRATITIKPLKNDELDIIEKYATDENRMKTIFAATVAITTDKDTMNSFIKNALFSLDNAILFL